MMQVRWQVLVLAAVVALVGCKSKDDGVQGRETSGNPHDDPDNRPKAKAEDHCSKAIDHLFTGPGGGGNPPADVVKMAKKSCTESGLSQAQYDCIMAVKAPADVERLGDCPAIAAATPDWLKALLPVER